MKRFSDYQGEEAIELWGDLLGPISRIIQDNDIRAISNKKDVSRLDIAGIVLKKRKSDVVTILERIDPTPVNGINIIVRLIDLLEDLGSNPEVARFFGLPATEKLAVQSSGSATENIKVEEN